MKFNKKIKLIVSSLMLAPFIMFSKVNAMENNQLAQNNRNFMLIYDGRETDTDCWLEVKYDTINGVNGIVLNCVFPQRFGKSTADKDSINEFAEHHYIEREFDKLHYRNNPIDDFKFIIYNANGQLVAIKNIKSKWYYFDQDNEGSYLSTLSYDYESDNLLRLQPGSYTIYLNNGNETLGMFRNVVIQNNF